MIKSITLLIFLILFGSVVADFSPESTETNTADSQTQSNLVSESEQEDKAAHDDVDVGEEEQVYSAIPSESQLDDFDSDVEDEGSMSMDRDFDLITSYQDNTDQELEDQMDIDVSASDVETTRALVGNQVTSEVKQEGKKPFFKFTKMVKSGQSFLQLARQLRGTMKGAIKTVKGRSPEAKKAFRCYRQFKRSIAGYESRVVAGMRKLANSPVGFVHTFGSKKLAIVKARAQKARLAIEAFHKLSSEEIQDFDESWFADIWSTASDFIQDATAFASTQWNRAVSGLAGLSSNVFGYLKSMGSAVMARVGAVLAGIGQGAKMVARGIRWVASQVKAVILKFGDFIEAHITPRLCRGVTGMFGSKAWGFMKRNAGTIFGIALAATGALAMPAILGAAGVSAGLLVSTTLWGSIGGCIGSVFGELVANPDNAEGATLMGILGAIPGGKIAFGLGKQFVRVLGPTAIKVATATIGKSSMNVVTSTLAPNVVSTMFGKAATQASVRAIATNSAKTVSRAVTNAAKDTAIVTAASSPRDLIDGLKNLLTKKLAESTSGDNSCPPPPPPAKRSSFWG